jgi:flagellar basal body-associated protein FliL
MLKFLQRRLKSQKGAMDSIMVTLLMVVIGVGAIVGIASWLGDKKEAVITEADSQITTITTETDAMEEVPAE